MLMRRRRITTPAICTGSLLLAVTSMLGGFSGACGTPAPQPESTHVPGSLIFLRSAQGGFRGALTAWNEATGERTLAGDVAPLEFSAPIGHTSKIVFSEASNGALPRIQLVDPARLSTRTLTKGHYARLGPTGSFAYCDGESRTVIAATSSPDPIITSSSRASNCRPGAWSQDGSFALLEATDGANAELYVWSPSGGDMRKVALSVGLVGAGAPSWSSDSTTLALSTGRGVAIVEPQSGQVAFVDAYGVPRFSPAVPEVLAILDVAAAQPTLTVYRNGERVAARSDFSDQPPMDFAWSPDGRQIAYVSDAAVTVWDWGGGGTRVVAGAESGGFAGSIAWMSGYEDDPSDGPTRNQAE